MVNTTATSSSVVPISPNLSINSIFGTAPASISARGFRPPFNPRPRSGHLRGFFGGAADFGVRMVRMVEHDARNLSPGVGLDHFRAYVWSSVFAYNLALFARLKLI